MKNSQNAYRIKPLLLVLVIFLFSNVVFAQTDTTQVTQTESKKQDKQKDEGKREKKKRKNEFKVFAGVNFNKLIVSQEKYNSTIAPGYLLGASYKQGKFFYWEAGVRFNNAVYNLKDVMNPPDSSAMFDDIFGVRNIDIPLTVGINILSVTSRIVGLRVFVSAVPAFLLDVGDNNLGLSKDNSNTFNIYGQGGVGVDVAFIFVEAGVNYGFIDLMNYDKSNPIQIFVNLGFRF